MCRTEPGTGGGRPAGPSGAHAATQNQPHNAIGDAQDSASLSLSRRQDVSVRSRSIFRTPWDCARTQAVQPAEFPRERRETPSTPQGSRPNAQGSPHATQGKVSSRAGEPTTPRSGAPVTMQGSPQRTQRRAQAHAAEFLTHAAEPLQPHSRAPPPTQRSTVPTARPPRASSQRQPPPAQKVPVTRE